MKSLLAYVLGASALLALSVLTVTASTNLVVNGDFSANGADFGESPGYVGGGNPSSIPGWKLETWGGGGNFGINGANGHSAFGPADQSRISGYYGFIQGGNNAHFAQDFDFAPGANYRIEFKSAARDGRVSFARVNFHNDALAGTDAHLRFDPANSSFQTYSFDFATPAELTGSTTLWLMFMASQGGAYGDIVVTEIPEVENALTYDAPDGNSIIITDLAGPGGLVKEGAGTLTLTGENVYTGATAVNAGSLVLNGSTHADSTVTVSPGASIGGTGVIGGNLVVETGGRLLFSATGSLTVNGSYVSLGEFGVGDLVDLTSDVRNGVYTLIDGTATINTTSLSNVGEENAFDLGDGKRAYFEEGSFKLVVIADEPDISIYHWTAAGSNTSWGTLENWDSPPIFDDRADLAFNTATTASSNPSFSYLAEHRVARSLLFGADLVTGATTYDIRFNIGGGGANTAARNLTLQANEGNASITLEEGYGADGIQSMVRLGNNNGGGASIILGNDLDIFQHSPHALLQMNQPVAESGGSFAINKYGQGELTMVRGGSYSGGFNLHQGTVNFYAGSTALGTGTVSIGSTDSEYADDDAVLNFGGGDRTYTNDFVIHAGSGARTFGMFNFGATAGGGNLTGSIMLHNDLTFAASDLDPNFRGLLVSGVISGEGGVIIEGAAGTAITFDGENAYTGATAVNSGTLEIGPDGSISGSSEIVVATGATFDVSAKPEGFVIGSGVAVGGNGTVIGDLTFESGAKLRFEPSATLTVNGTSVEFHIFGIADVEGLDGNADIGVYTLIDGSANIDWTNVSNVGESNAVNIGGGKAAYFQGGSLQVAVIESGIAIETYEEWADRFNLAGNDRQQEGDPDGDGLTNYAEYLLGTDPTDPSSRFAINPIQGGAGVGFSFKTIQGRIYHVERSIDLINWNPADDPITGNGTVIDFSDTDTSDDRAFYRIRVELQ